MRDDKKEVHIEPRMNVPIHSGPTGAIQQPGGAQSPASKQELFQFHHLFKFFCLLIQLGRQNKVMVEVWLHIDVQM